MEKTSKLQLPYVLSSQAQKHITHNEALRSLDAIIHLSAISRNQTTPPSSTTDGDRYIADANSTGDWTGKDFHIVAWQDGSWMFYPPQTGWLCWIEDENTHLLWNGTGWININTGNGSLNAVSLIGVNTTADQINKLSVSSQASLFNHEGSDHRLKINKQLSSDTASVLFQNDYTGHAEFGLSGDNDFHMKVSPDGSTFHEAILVDKDTGYVSIGGGEPIEKLHIKSGNILLDNNQRLSVKDTSGNSQRIFHMGADNNCYFNVNGLANRVRFFTSNSMRLDMHANGSLVVGSPSGGGKGEGTINAKAIYDDNALLSCYVFDQALDEKIDHEKWDQKVCNIFDEEGDLTQKRIHHPMRKFKSRAGTEYDPLTLDGYSKHWQEKRHLTSMPNEDNYDIEKGLSSGEWIQRLIETVEIQAVLIETLNKEVKKINNKLE
ncbi:hypothetical protein NBRC116602_28980 [Hyphomicrobiales bacterium 4NK60-0047b]|jgi:hypothetical protein